MNATIFDESTEIICSYSRADAIDDGYLVDITDAASKVGFRFPVAVTQAVWEDCIYWTDADNDHKGICQDIRSRLQDVVTIASLATRAARLAGTRTDWLTFSLYRVPREGKGVRPRLVALKMICSPGDNAEPVITIMLPDED